MATVPRAPSFNLPRRPPDHSAAIQAAEVGHENRLEIPPPPKQATTRAPIFNLPRPPANPYPAIAAAEVGHENRLQLGVSQFPETPPTYDFPNPRAAIASMDLRTFVRSNILAVSLNPTPVGMDDWPTPRAAVQPSSLRTHTETFKPGLVGQDRFFTSPGRGPVYDFPNPRGRDVGYASRQITVRRSSGASAPPPPPLGVPFSQLDWLVPVARPWPMSLRTFGSGPGAPEPSPSPFTNEDFPVPGTTPWSAFLRSWTDTYFRHLIEKDQFFTDPGHAPTYDFPNPRSPQFPLDLRTWIQLAQQLYYVPTPFNLDDWPNPRSPAWALELRTWLASLKLNLQGQDTFFGAAGMAPTYDYPNPRSPLRASSLGIWTWGSPNTLVFIPPPPPPTAGVRKSPAYMRRLKLLGIREDGGIRVEWKP